MPCQHVIIAEGRDVVCADTWTCFPYCSLLDGVICIETYMRRKQIANNHCVQLQEIHMDATSMPVATPI
jgi:hypothetical protein